nr:hypothetical protein [Tanacetum cinerariifolium]
RIGEEERMNEEEEADELYRDVDINQGRGLQVSQETEDSHVILTPTQSDAQQESSLTSSFMTNLLNPTIDPSMESIFTTGSTTVTPIPSPQSTMTTSIISTFTTARQLPTPPTQIPSLDLQSLPTFALQIPKAVREAVQTQTDRLQDSIQIENDEFLKTIDENMRKIIKEQVKTQVKASSHSSRTSYAVAADLSEMELKKILIEKMEGRPSVGSNRGSKRQREGREHASANTPSEPATGGAGRSTTGTQSRQLSASAEDQPIVQTSQHPEWFSQPSRPPTPDRDWNKSFPAAQGDPQSWISALAKQTDARSSFNELLDTPIDFSNFIMNRLGIDTLTPDLLAGPTYELMKGSCNSLIELEYHLEEVYKATTYQLDWVNPEGQQYPHNLLQPLPLIPDNQGRRVIPFEHFINNDLEYLRGGASSQKYTTSVTKTKAADYGHIKWIEELFYGFAVNRESALDVYSKRRIIAVTNLKIVEWHDYKHLDWISVRRDDDKIYKFKEGDFKRLRLQDIEDMLLLLIQRKLSNLTIEEQSEDDDNNEEDQGLRIGEEERMNEEEEADELYRDVDINQGRGLQVSQEIEDSHVILTPTQSDAQQESSSTSSFMTNLLNPTMDPGMESIFTTGSTTVTPIPSPQSTMTTSIISTFTTASQLPTPPTQIPSLDLQSLPTFTSVFRFEDRVKFLEDNFSNIPGIVNQYMHQQIPKAVREAIQTQTDRLQDSIQRENDEFLKTIDENMRKIIKEQVKTQVKAQVTRILPRIEESVNTQLEAEVLTRSSYSSRTSYAVAADLSEMELKKILIEKMEGNKESAILKRRREDDDQEGPSVGSNRGSKRQREGGEHASANTLSEPATGGAGRSTTRTQSRQLSASAEDQPIVQTSQHPEWFSQPSRPPTPDRDWNKSFPAAQGDAQSWISALAKQTDARSSFSELLDTPIDFSNFIMNRLGVDTLTPDLLAGPTYELMKGSCNSLIELEYHLEDVYKATTYQLDWVNPEGQQYPHNLLQPLPLIPDNQGRRFYGFAVNRESALDVYSKRRIIAVTNLKIVEWHDYKHLDWISVCRDDDKIYKLKEGNFKRLRLQDIEDMLLLLIQRKLSNLTVEERVAFNVSLRMFTRSIVIQRRVEDLQLGVESYQKRLNLTKPDKYRSDLKRREAYTAHSNPRGFIYQNKDKKNRLMRIDELHKFSDETLNDVRNALDDRLKGIQM